MQALVSIETLHSRLKMLLRLSLLPRQEHLPKMVNIHQSLSVVLLLQLAELLPSLLIAQVESMSTTGILLILILLLFLIILGHLACLLKSMPMLLPTIVHLSFVAASRTLMALILILMENMQLRLMMKSLRLIPQNSLKLILRLFPPQIPERCIR